MQLIPLSSLTIGERQRKSRDAKKIVELRESILARGLLHAPVVWREGDQFHLCAGEGRVTAIKQIAEAGRIYSYDNIEITPGHIPVTEVSESLGLADRFALELDENVLREELPWQDRIEAFAMYHRLRQQENPKQSIRQTATELIDQNKTPTEGQSLSNVQKQIHTAVLINQYLDDPTIARARNETEARNLVYKKIEEEAKAEIARRRIASAPSRPDVEIRFGDCRDVVPALDAARFDLIIADPPYGVGADSDAYRARTVQHHNYEDTPDTARDLLRLILTEGFRVTRQKANIFLFTDIMHWDWLQNVAANLGWKPFRTPIIWQKSEGEGLAPWGASGPRRVYEIIFFATKGLNGGLHASPIDVFNVKRVPRRERIHAAEKPVELLRRLIECSTLPGDTILDPCCGSGSTLVAALETKRKALGIEKDRTFYTTAMANVYHNGETDGKTETQHPE